MQGHCSRKVIHGLRLRNLEESCRGERILRWRHSWRLFWGYRWCRQYRLLGRSGRLELLVWNFWWRCEDSIELLAGTLARLWLEVQGGTSTFEAYAVLALPPSFFEFRLIFWDQIGWENEKEKLSWATIRNQQLGPWQGGQEWDLERRRAQMSKL